MNDKCRPGWALAKPGAALPHRQVPDFAAVNPGYSCLAVVGSPRFHGGHFFGFAGAIEALMIFLHAGLSWFTLRTRHW